MSQSDISEYERRALKLAVALALTLHLSVLAVLCFGHGGEPENQLRPLAVLEFAYFDPEGGEPGGSQGDEFAAGPEAEPLPASEPEPVPEPEPISESEALKIIESTSVEAAPLPPPSVAEVKPEPKLELKPKPKPKPKPKSKPKPKAAAAPAETPSSASLDGGLAEAQTRTGGGAGVGRGGAGGGTGRGNPNALDAYRAQLMRKLNRYKKYPAEARSQGVTGTVTVNFTVNRQGNVLSSHMVKSSGRPVLDQEALALLRRVSPFPAMPREMAGQTLNVTAPIQFTYRR